MVLSVDCGPCWSWFRDCRLWIDQYVGHEHFGTDTRDRNAAGRGHDSLANPKDDFGPSVDHGDYRNCAWGFDWHLDPLRYQLDHDAGDRSCGPFQNLSLAFGWSTWFELLIVVIAAMVPAERAARLNVSSALQYE